MGHHISCHQFRCMLCLSVVSLRVSWGHSIAVASVWRIVHWGAWIWSSFWGVRIRRAPAATVDGWWWGICWKSCRVLGVLWRPNKCWSYRERWNIGICWTACLSRRHRTTITDSRSFVCWYSCWWPLFLILGLLQLLKLLLKAVWWKFSFKLVFFNAFENWTNCWLLFLSSKMLLNMAKNQ